MAKAKFDAGDQGWGILDDVAQSEWRSTQGNPGGFVHWGTPTTGGDAYWQASAAFDGRHTNAYGGTLSYDIYSSGADYTGVPDVELRGTNGVTLVATVGQPDRDWTHFSIGLATGEGCKVGDLAGADATRADIKGVLRDIADILIRAEYATFRQDGGLDNVKLVGPDHGAHLDALAVGAAHSFVGHELLALV